MDVAKAAPLIWALAGHTNITQEEHHIQIVIGLGVGRQRLGRNAAPLGNNRLDAVNEEGGLLNYYYREAA